MKKKKNNIDISKIILVSLIIGVAIWSVFHFFVKENQYTKMEKLLVEAANTYVKNNSISLKNEMYFNMIKLGVSLSEDCDFTSGVFYGEDGFVPYLSCKEYESKINETSNEFVSLNGKSVYILAKGVNFYDPGYTSTSEIRVIGEVGKEEGVYNIYYSPVNTNTFINRKIAVVDNLMIRELFPSISLYGEDIVYTLEGENYHDEGVMATIGDEVLTDNVKVYGNVDTSKIGDYKLDYVITNNFGYSNSVSRIVKVISPIPTLSFYYQTSPNKLTNKDVSINVKVNGDDFAYMILPNKEEDKRSELSYKVSENGVYEFIVYDDKGRNITEKVEVNNIDRAKPEASCVATWYYNRTEVVVNTTSNKVISNYEYYIDNTVKNSVSNTLTSDIVKPKNISVKVTDEIENTDSFICTINDQSTPQIYVDSHGYRCLEGYTCYRQKDWSSSQYYFCSDAQMKSCGTLSGHGCSLMSLTTVVSKFGVKASNGQLHTPYTMLSEIYNGTGIARNGICSAGCSAWTPMKKAAIALGLTTQDKNLPFKRENVEIFKDYLRRGYGVILHVDVGAFSTGRHFIAALGIRDDDYVYIYNPNRLNDNKSLTTGIKQNDWVSIDDLIKGNVNQFFAIGKENN